MVGNGGGSEKIELRVIEIKEARVRKGKHESTFTGKNGAAKMQAIKPGGEKVKRKGGTQRGKSPGTWFSSAPLCI